MQGPPSAHYSPLEENNGRCEALACELLSACDLLVSRRHINLRSAAEEAVTTPNVLGASSS